MSDSLRDNWPSPEAPLHEHAEFIKTGRDALKNAMALPVDGRFDVAYTMLASGAGRQGAVLAIGPSGTGKSDFGNQVFGNDMRHEVAPEEDGTSLFGFTNPIDASETIKGTLIHGMESQRAIYVNEASHLRNVAPLLRVFENGDFHTVDDRFIAMDGAAIYITSNFPSRGRVYDIDAALRSRVAIEIVTGDASKTSAQGIHKAAWGSEGHREIGAPLLPPPEVRQAVREQFARVYPVGNEQQLGNFTVSLAERLSANPILFQADNTSLMTDARLSHSLREAARARKIVDGKADEDRVITVSDVATIAALVMPKMLKLNPAAGAALSEASGIDMKVRPLDEAIIIRRIVARAAFELLAERNPAGYNPAHVERMTEVYTYANIESSAIDPETVDKAASDLRQGINSASELIGSDHDKRRSWRKRASRS